MKMFAYKERKSDSKVKCMNEDGETIDDEMKLND